MTYSAMTIAKWFVAWAEADEADLSNLKLQKLLYYAQGHHLAANGKPLFDEPIQAWTHGPVVKPVYHEFKRFGSGDLHLDNNDPFEWSDVDEETALFLATVWNTYGEFAAWRLRNMTHNEAPWVNAFDVEKHNPVISQDSLRAFFERRTLEAA